MNSKKKNITVFAGSGVFASLLLPYIANKIKNLLVITQKGKNIPVHLASKKLDLPVLETFDKNNLENLIEKKRPKFIIVADFGIIISKKTLEIPEKVINIHPSLLPKYRGPSPYVTALINQEKETGVSAMDIVPEIDAGPVYVKKSIKIERSETKISLEKKLAKLSGKIIEKNLIDILSDEIIPIKQDHKNATYTKILKKEDGKINWKESSDKIEAKIRALNPWPGTFTEIFANNKKIILKILEADALNTNNNNKTREIKIEKNSFSVKTGSGYLLIKKVLPEGKKPMTAKDFLSGHGNIKII